MAKIPGRRELKNHLRQLTHEQLINHLLYLGDAFNEVQGYLQNVVRPADEDAVRARYQRVIESEFFPARGYGKARLSIARKAVTDYGKVALTTRGPADLMLFYVETGLRFAREFGVDEAAFYVSMLRMSRDALDWIVAHGLEAEFHARCQQLLDATEGMGWGVHDTLFSEYHDRFGDWLADQE
jgi:hypothetical protein